MLSWLREFYRERFIEGARSRGVDADTAAEIWRQMASFGGYAFCKAHSAAFAAVSFQAAFLKMHFPAAFMAAGNSESLQRRLRNHAR